MDDLEKLYSPSQWCSYRCDPNLVVQKHVETVSQESLKVRKELQFIENVRYGEGPREVLDIFEPVIESKSGPTFIYIHGGYWQELNKNISSYCVKPLIQANIRVIIPGYDLAPNVTLETIIVEIKNLAKFIDNMAKERQWKNIWYCGHSAGAHLAASLLCSKISSRSNIAGFILISGIYDLEPLIHTSVNKGLKLNSDNCRHVSPLFNLSPRNCTTFRVVIVVAEFDSPAFHEQSIAFKKELEKFQSNVRMLVMKDTDHFTIVENLKTPDSLLVNIIMDEIWKTSPSKS